MMQAQLGMIPAWQYSLDPGVNIKLNDHVQFPSGWTQGTIQPVGAYYDVARIAQPSLNGFGQSWAYENRRALLIGGISLLAAAALGITSHLSK